MDVSIRTWLALQFTKFASLLYFRGTAIAQEATRPPIQCQASSEFYCFQKIMALLSLRSYNHLCNLTQNGTTAVL